MLLLQSLKRLKIFKLKQAYFLYLFPGEEIS